MSLQTELHVEEARFTPRLRRALQKSRERMRARVRLQALAEALASKNMAQALKAVGEDDLEKALEPFGAICEDAFIRGGKVGARFI